MSDHCDQIGQEQANCDYEGPQTDRVAHDLDRPALESPGHRNRPTAQDGPNHSHPAQDHTLFGIPQVLNHPARGFGDYSHYPSDVDGTHMAENARLWKIYYNEAQNFDNEMLQEYNQSIDVLLVFVRAPTHAQSTG